VTLVGGSRITDIGKGREGAERRGASLQKGKRTTKTPSAKKKRKRKKVMYGFPLLDPKTILK